VIAFSVVGVVVLFALIVAQTWLPLRQGAAGMGLTTAVNTAVSFVTNTDWQSYADEVGTTPLVQTAGLTVQNFASAAVGMAVAVALIRALARHNAQAIGNFWVDLVRGTVRVLLPRTSRIQAISMAGRRRAGMPVTRVGPRTSPPDRRTS
jgi:K+-transporting ATPase ATPase A chain